MSRGNRGLGFDQTVRRYDYLLRLLIKRGPKSIRGKVAVLNAAGICNPDCRAWSYGSLRRMLVRGEQLGLWSCSGAPMDAKGAAPDPIANSTKVGACSK